MGSCWFSSCEHCLRADEKICVTLFDWRTWPQQFAKSKHPDERALFRMLSIEVGPKVIEALVVSCAVIPTLFTGFAIHI